MAKGITETDVWQAADALLLEGGRPTIERVRQKVGRGSPNTVTPYLDTWFKHLGGRIKDPGAFSAPAALPDPIHQAAQHFWEVALAEARKETEDKLADGLAGAEQAIAQAARRVDVAESTATRLKAELGRATNDLAIANESITQKTLAHATTRVQLETAKDQTADLVERLRLLESQLQTVRDEAQSHVAAADARATIAEKRAALDMDRERVAKSNAEKRLATTQGKLEKTQGELSAERVEHASHLAKLRADIAQQELQRDVLAKGLAKAQQEVQAVSSKLIAAESRADKAKNQAEIAKALFDQLKPTLTQAKSRKPRALKS